MDPKSAAIKNAMAKKRYNTVTLRAKNEGFAVTLRGETAN